MATTYDDFLAIVNSFKLIQDLNERPLEKVAKDFGHFSRQHISEEIVSSFALKGLSNEDFLMSDFLTKYGIKTLIQLDFGYLDTGIKEVWLQKCKEFVATLKGCYQPHFSDIELAYLLHKKLVEELSLIEGQISDKTKLGNAAYKSSLLIFQDLLEYKLSYPGNGHHKAQKFADVFNPQTNN